MFNVEPDSSASPLTEPPLKLKMAPVNVALPGVDTARVPPFWLNVLVALRVAPLLTVKLLLLVAVVVPLLRDRLPSTSVVPLLMRFRDIVALESAVRNAGDSMVIVCVAAPPLFFHSAVVSSTMPCLISESPDVVKLKP